MPSPALAQRVEAYLSAGSVSVGDRFTLTLVALHGFAAHPSFPDPSVRDSTFGDLEVIGVTASGGRFLGTNNPGARLDSIVYEVTTFALDTALVPALPVYFAADANADTAQVASAPIILPVISHLGPDAAGIRDLTPLIEFDGPIWPYVLLGLALLILAGLVFYYFRSKRRAPEPEPPPPPPVPQVSAYEAALARLRMLDGTDLDAPAHIKPFYVELSDVLRTYLEDSLSIPALERTTRELMGEFEQHTVRHKLPGGAPQRVHGILELADLVKFADVRPPASQSRMALDETRKTVDVIEAKLRQIALERARLAPPPDAMRVPPAHVTAEA
jgi:hypothetical protein